MEWRKGRGPLGIFRPLVGAWTSQPVGNSPASLTPCTRTFTSIWNGSYIRLEAHWTLSLTKAYEEVAMFGKARDGSLAFWSFQSDGKSAEGRISEARDVHPDAIAFEAMMPAGLARFAYWPDDDAGFHYAVESRTKNGWNRFLEHLYLPLAR